MLDLGSHRECIWLSGDIFIVASIKVKLGPVIIVHFAHIENDSIKYFRS